jgi:hypothetical protein
LNLRGINYAVREMSTDTVFNMYGTPYTINTKRRFSIWVDLSLLIGLFFDWVAD